MVKVFNFFHDYISEVEIESWKFSIFTSNELW